MYDAKAKDWQVSNLLWPVALRFIDKQLALLALIDTIAEIPERVCESLDMQMDTYAGTDLVEWESIRRDSYEGEVRYIISRSTRLRKTPLMLMLLFSIM